jgi:hypothetical protein
MSRGKRRTLWCVGYGPKDEGNKFRPPITYTERHPLDSQICMYLLHKKGLIVLKFRGYGKLLAPKKRGTGMQRTNSSGINFRLHANVNKDRTLISHTANDKGLALSCVRFDWTQLNLGCALAIFRCTKYTFNRSFTTELA